jgi:hypothetical protein
MAQKKLAFGNGMMDMAIIATLKPQIKTILYV